MRIHTKHTKTILTASLFNLLLMNLLLFKIPEKKEYIYLKGQFCHPYIIGQFVPKQLILARFLLTPGKISL